MIINNKMKQKNIFIIGGIIIIILIIIGVYSQSGKENGESALSEQEGISGSKTAFSVPEGTVVPGQGEEGISEEVAIPVNVTNAAPDVEAKFRSFDISAENDKFIPSSIIVNSGDTVHIDFIAVDKSYDITFPDYGMKQVAQKGETKILEFQATKEGKFVYYCQSCGGLDSTAQGYIIIVNK